LVLGTVDDLRDERRKTHDVDFVERKGVLGRDEKDEDPDGQ
jgi:hypothetical protein